MTEEQALRKSCQINPAAILVYSDWLQERGDPLGEYLAYSEKCREIEAKHPEVVQKARELGGTPPILQGYEPRIISNEITISDREIYGSEEAQAYVQLQRQMLRDNTAKALFEEIVRRGYESHVKIRESFHNNRDNRLLNIRIDAIVSTNSALPPRWCA